jgi:hypothetical protein
MGESGMSIFDYEKQCQEQIDQYYIERLNFKPERHHSCRKWDFKFFKNGKLYAVEEKFRKRDFGDFLIEIMQDVPSKNMGWFYETEADYIFYVVQMEAIYIVKWQKFKNWFLQNWKSAKTTVQKSEEGYGLTLNIAISWSKIPSDIYEKRLLNGFF